MAAKRLPLITAAELALPATAMLVLAGMLAPVGPTLLDLLLSFSLALSLVVLVVAASNRTALDFSAFPTVLLIATLLRLSLNVASTRLILLHGNLGSAAAGVVIEAFGKVIVGDNYAVGIVVFIVLAIINFAVVTKGASRVAEVAARFTLDAMPGKQMAIDADLNAGIVGEEEARRRRRELGREADFYAAMDGIGKFVRGDAVAAIMIMAINLIAGLFIGIAEKGLSLSDALHTYTILTVGDGLAAQVPALLTSTAAGVIVSRTSSDLDLPHTIGKELLRNPGTLFGAGGLLGLIGLLPGLPICRSSRWRLRWARSAHAAAARPSRRRPKTPLPSPRLPIRRPVRGPISSGSNSARRSSPSSTNPGNSPTRFKRCAPSSARSWVSRCLPCASSIISRSINTLIASRCAAQPGNQRTRDQRAGLWPPRALGHQRTVHQGAPCGLHRGRCAHRARDPFC